MTTTVHISMKVTIRGKVYTVNGTAEIRESYFDGFSRMEFPISARAAELAKILKTKVEEGDYSSFAE
jgi:hypothetical protein